MEDSNNDGRVSQGEVANIVLRIYNTGEGEARAVTADVRLGEHTYLAGKSKLAHSVGTLKAGAYKDVSFEIYTDREIRSNEILLTVTLAEAKGKYGSTQTVRLPLDRPAPRYFTVEPRPQPQEKPGFDGLSVDVDVNIPKTSMRNPNAVAVVIGIRDYLNPSVPRVEYAKRDAQFVREYLINTLGYDPKNILPQNPDDLMTTAMMKTLIRVQLPDFIRKEKSDVFFYFSGHGAPSTEMQKAFFVPCDGNPNYVSKDNAYLAEELYADLARLQARSLTVVVDACFSGYSGDGKMIIQKASPAVWEVNNPVASLMGQRHVIAFLSSSASQISSWYPEKQHGLFTYFFLKGLQGKADANGDGKLTVQELHDYLSDENDGVPYWALRKFGRPQTPQIITPDTHKVLVEYER